MLPLLLAMAANPDPVVMVREPRAASPWTQIVQASCGQTAIAVAGYGARRPLDKAATVRVNGRPLVGEAVRRLQQDLSHRRAVYRFQLLCDRSGGITLRIGEGERQVDGAVRYRSANAGIRRGRLEAYTGLQESNADSFWFR